MYPATDISIHGVTAIRIERKTYPDHSPEFSTVKLMLTLSDDHAMEVCFYTDDPALVISDPGAPAVPWADADADAADAEMCPVFIPNPNKYAGIIGRYCGKPMPCPDHSVEVPALNSPDHLDLSEPGLTALVADVTDDDPEPGDTVHDLASALMAAGNELQALRNKPYRPMFPASRPIDYTDEDETRRVAERGQRADDMQTWGEFGGQG